MVRWLVKLSLKRHVALAGGRMCPSQVDAMELKWTVTYINIEDTGWQARFNL
jgi:hypothetical protein